MEAAVFSLSVSPTCLAHAPAIKIDEFLFLKTLKSDRNERDEAYITLQYYTKGSQTLFPVVVIQLPSHVWLFVTPWNAACQASLFLTISWSLPKFMSVASVMLSSHVILWCPLLLLPSIFPSIRDFSNESSVPIRWPKYWSFNFSISPSSEYSGLISLQFDWSNLFAVQGTFKSLLQHHSLKASTPWCSVFFTV